MPPTLHSLFHFLADFVAIVFLLSGIFKLVGMRSFRLGLLLLPYMTETLAYAVSVLLPLVELALSILLFLNICLAKYAAIVLLALFAGVALLAIAYGRSVPCGCFGSFSANTLSGATILRNLFLIGITLLLLAFRERSEWWLTPWQTAFAMLFVLIVVQGYKNNRLLRDLRKVGIQ